MPLPRHVIVCFVVTLSLATDTTCRSILVYFRFIIFDIQNGWNTTDWSAHRTFCFVSYILLSLRKYKYNDLLIIITINFRISLIYAKLLILDKDDQGLVFYVKKLRLLVYTLLEKLDIEMTISLHLEYERFCLQEV